MKCPYCNGTGNECGCGQGKCDHCINGVVADYPLGQPKRAGRGYLSDPDRSALASYWASSTRIETLGEFIDRVAYQAVETYKKDSRSMAARTVTPLGMTWHEHLAHVEAWLETNKIRLHAAGCSVYSPSAQCSCGAYKSLTDVRAVLNHMKEQANEQAKEGETGGAPSDGS